MPRPKPALRPATLYIRRLEAAIERQNKQIAILLAQNEKLQSQLEEARANRSDVS